MQSKYPPIRMFKRILELMAPIEGIESAAHWPVEQPALQHSHQPLEATQGSATAQLTELTTQYITAQCSASVRDWSGVSPTRLSSVTERCLRPGRPSHRLTICPSRRHGAWAAQMHARRPRRCCVDPCKWQKWLSWLESRRAQ